MTIPQKPFKFLDSYCIEDKDIFFGRTDEIEEIYRKFYQSKLLLVFGKSGSGKSSIINCGLLSKIDSADIYPIRVRCKNHPYQNFMTELKKHSSDSKDDAKSLLENIFLEHYKPIAFIFDQFEEVFIQSTKNERQQFIKEIKNILSIKTRLNIIFIIREEYLANLTEFERDISGLFDNRIRIEPLKWLLAKEAIEKPCKQCSVGIEEGLADEILKELTRKEDKIELTYLQIVMDRLYKLAVEESSSEPVLKIAYLKKIGKLDNILSDFLDEQLVQIQSPEIAEFILKQMVTCDGTKKPISTQELLDALNTNEFHISKETLQEMIDYFIRVRIIHDKDDNDNYELRHDSLAARVYERMDIKERDILKIKKNLTIKMNEYKEGIGALLNKEFLDYIAQYSFQLQLSGDLKDFVDKSKQVIMNKKRRWVAVAILVLVGYIGLIGFSTTYFRSKINNLVTKKNIAINETNKAIEEKKQIELEKRKVEAEKKQVEEEKSKVEAEKRQSEAEKSKVEELAQNAQNTLKYYQNNGIQTLFDTKPVKKEGKIDFLKAATLFVNNNSSIIEILKSTDVEYINNQGILLFYEGDYFNALLLFTRILTLDPYDKNAWYNKGLCFENLEDYNMAAKQYERVIKIDSLYRASYIGLGYINYCKDSLNLALNYYKKAIEIDPNDTTLLNEIGVIYYKQGNYEQAIKQYFLALEISPVFRNALFNLGLCYFKKDDYQKALEYFTKTLEISKTYSRALQNIVLTYYCMRDTVRTIYYCNKLIELEPKNINYLNYMASFYEVYNNYDSSLYYYRKIIEIDSTNPNSYNKIMNIYFNQKKYSEAVRTCRNYIRINNKDADFWGSLSWYYLFLKDYYGALNAANKGILMDKDKDFIYTNQLHAYLLTNQFEKAKQVFAYRKNTFVNGLCFKDIITRDFQDLSDAGITIPRQEEFINYMNSVKP